MKKMLRNPNFYYLLVPVAALLWALTAGFIFYPKSVAAWQDSQSEYQNAQEWIEKLVTLQPKRLTFKVDPSAKPEEFDFTKTINEFAQVFSISSANYTSNVRGEVKRAGRQSRSAAVTIKSIDIERLAQFLSAMLLRWPDLNCEVLSLEKGKAGKNDWKAELTLTYYYE
jgi:hypothetical protein